MTNATAVSFTLGAGLPLMAAYFSPLHHLLTIIATCSLIFLIGLGSMAATTGGTSKRFGALRVAFWGALGMGATAIVGQLLTL